TLLTTDLSTWLEKLQQKIAIARDTNPEQLPPLKVLLEPQQQMIGESVYEVAFIADADGLPLELIRVLNSAT
ncbi:MAG: VOC family protein, partial [Waterburya sp.]